MIRHLLEHPPVAAPVQLRKHEIAKRIILLTLPQAQIQGADPKYRHEGMMKSSVTQEVVSSNQGKGMRGVLLRHVRGVEGVATTRLRRRWLQGRT